MMAVEMEQNGDLRYIMVAEWTDLVMNCEAMRKEEFSNKCHFSNNNQWMNRDAVCGRWPGALCGLGINLRVESTVFSFRRINSSEIWSNPLRRNGLLSPKGQCIPLHCWLYPKGGCDGEQGCVQPWEVGTLTQLETQDINSDPPGEKDRVRLK